MSSTSHFAPTVTFTLLNPTDARDELRTSYSTLNRREIRIAQRDLARMREAEVSSGVEPNQNTAAGENHITSFSSSSSREEVAENGPNPPHYPGPRSGHSVLYSSFLKASVLYAGMDYDESHADVWLLRVRRKIDDTPTVAEAVHRSDRAGEDDEEDAEHTHNNEKKGERQSSVSASLAAEENKYVESDVRVVSDNFVAESSTSTEAKSNGNKKQQKTIADLYDVPALDGTERGKRWELTYEDWPESVAPCSGSTSSRSPRNSSRQDEKTAREACFGHAACLFDNDRKMFVHGGTTSNGELLDAPCYLDLATKVWHPLYISPAEVGIRFRKRARHSDSDEDNNKNVKWCGDEALRYYLSNTHERPSANENVDDLLPTVDMDSDLEKCHSDNDNDDAGDSDDVFHIDDLELPSMPVTSSESEGGPPRASNHPIGPRWGHSASLILVPRSVAINNGWERGNSSRRLDKKNADKQQQQQQSNDVADLADTLENDNAQQPRTPTFFAARRQPSKHQHHQEDVEGDPRIEFIVIFAGDSKRLRNPSAANSRGFTDDERDTRRDESSAHLFVINPRSWESFFISQRMSGFILCEYYASPDTFNLRDPLPIIVNKLLEEACRGACGENPNPLELGISVPRTADDNATCICNSSDCIGEKDTKSDEVEQDKEDHCWVRRALKPIGIAYPHPRRRHSAAVYEGRYVVVFGGRTVPSDTFRGDTWVFDGYTCQWTPLEDHLTPQWLGIFFGNALALLGERGGGVVGLYNAWRRLKADEKDCHSVTSNFAGAARSEALMNFIKKPAAFPDVLRVFKTTQALAADASGSNLHLRDFAFDRCLRKRLSFRVKNPRCPALDLHGLERDQLSGADATVQHNVDRYLPAPFGECTNRACMNIKDMAKDGSSLGSGSQRRTQRNLNNINKGNITELSAPPSCRTGSCSAFFGDWYMVYGGFSASGRVLRGRRLIQIIKSFNEAKGFCFGGGVGGVGGGGGLGVTPYTSFTGQGRLVVGSYDEMFDSPPAMTMASLAVIEKPEVKSKPRDLLSSCPTALDRYESNDFTQYAIMYGGRIGDTPSATCYLMEVMFRKPEFDAEVRTNTEQKDKGEEKNKGSEEQSPSAGGGQEALHVASYSSAQQSLFGSDPTNRSEEARGGGLFTGSPQEGATANTNNGNINSGFMYRVGETPHVPLTSSVFTRLAQVAQQRGRREARRRARLLRRERTRDTREEQSIIDEETYALEETTELAELDQIRIMSTMLPHKPLSFATCTSNNAYRKGCLSSRRETPPLKASSSSSSLSSCGQQRALLRDLCVRWFTSRIPFYDLKARKAAFDELEDSILSRAFVESRGSSGIESEDLRHSASSSSFLSPSSSVAVGTNGTGENTNSSNTSAPVQYGASPHRFTIGSIAARVLISLIRDCRSLEPPGVECAPEDCIKGVLLSAAAGQGAGLGTATPRAAVNSNVGAAFSPQQQENASGNGRLSPTERRTAPAQPDVDPNARSGNANVGVRRGEDNNNNDTHSNSSNAHATNQAVVVAAITNETSTSATPSRSGGISGNDAPNSEPPRLQGTQREEDATSRGRGGGVVERSHRMGGQGAAPTQALSSEHQRDAVVEEALALLVEATMNEERSRAVTGGGGYIIEDTAPRAPPPPPPPPPPRLGFGGVGALFALPNNENEEEEVTNANVQSMASGGVGVNTTGNATVNTNTEDGNPYNGPPTIGNEEGEGEYFHGYGVVGDDDDDDGDYYLEEDEGDDEYMLTHGDEFEDDIYEADDLGWIDGIDDTFYDEEGTDEDDEW